MSFNDKELRSLAIREAFVVVPSDSVLEWHEALSTSARFKLTTRDVLDRVRLAFGGDDPRAHAKVVASVLKGLEVPERSSHLVAVVAAYQIGLLLTSDVKTTTEVEVRDLAALACRVRGRGQPSVFGSLDSQGHAWLLRRGWQVRSGESVDAAYDPVAWSGELPAAVATPDAEQIRGAFNSLRQLVGSTRREAAAAIDPIGIALSRLSADARRRDERDEVTWWILSRDRYPQTSTEWAMNAANDLAAMNRFVQPLPGALEYFRRKARSRTESQTSEDEVVVDLRSSPSGEWAPIHNAIRQNDAAGDIADPAELAFALYDEILFSQWTSK